MLSRRFPTALRRVLHPGPTLSAPYPTHPPPCATLETLESPPSHRRTSLSPPPPPSPSPQFAVSGYGICAGWEISTSGADPAGTSRSRSPTPPPSTPPPSSSPPPPTPPPWSSPPTYSLYKILSTRGPRLQWRAHLPPWGLASWKTMRRHSYCREVQKFDCVEVLSPIPPPTYRSPACGSLLHLKTPPTLWGLTSWKIKHMHYCSEAEKPDCVEVLSPIPPPTYRSPACGSLLHLKTPPTLWGLTSWKIRHMHYCSQAEKPDERIPNNPFNIVWEDALTYFGDKECPRPLLLVQVPNRQEELYKLLEQNSKEPQMLTEVGKGIILSLVLPVLHCHEQDLCLGSSLELENFMVSSLGTLKLKKVSTIPLTKEARASDLKAVRKLIIQILRKRHGSKLTRKLPKSLLILLDKLSNSKTPTYLIKNDPSLLPAVTYGLAFLKLHGLLQDGLLKSDRRGAVQILKSLPYQKSSCTWIDIAQKSTMLSAWLITKKRTYNLLNPSHQMEFVRNMFSHVLEKKKEAAVLLGVQTAEYIPEAVAVLHQHSYPKLLSNLQAQMWKYYEQKNMIHVMESLQLEDLFPGGSIMSKRT